MQMFAPLIAAAEAHCVRHLVFADTSAVGERARRVAARLGDRAAFNARRLSAENIVANIDAGETEFTRPLPRHRDCRLDLRAARPAHPTRKRKVGLAEVSMKPSAGGRVGSVIPAQTGELDPSAPHAVSQSRSGSASALAIARL